MTFWCLSYCYVATHGFLPRILQFCWHMCLKNWGLMLKEYIIADDCRPKNTAVQACRLKLWRTRWQSGSKQSSQTRSLMLWWIVPAWICFKPFCERATSCSLNVWTSFSSGRWKKLSQKWSLIISLANYLIWSQTAAADIKEEFLIELWETSFQVLEGCTSIWP